MSKKFALYSLVSLLVLASMLLSSCGALATTAAPADTSQPAQQTTQTAESNQPTANPTSLPAKKDIVLEYWQVDPVNGDKAINAVIDLFEAENPGIKINYVSIPYEDMNQKIAAMVPVGQGPDVVNAYFGWIPTWSKAGFLAPLPEDLFPANEIREKYVKAVDAMFFDGQLWGLPLNVMNYAILYNEDFFAESGITKVPETWEELREAAIKCTKRDGNGNLIRAGYYLELKTQDHIMLKALIQKNGQSVVSDDLKLVTWNDSPIGEETFRWYMDLIQADKVMDVGFGEGVSAAFYSGQACMRVAQPSSVPIVRENAPDLNFGIAPLPKGNAPDPALANFNPAQYWSINITSKGVQDPDRAEAAYKFIKFLEKPEAIKAYISYVGGLPPLNELLTDPMFTDNEDLAPFMATLEYSSPLSWVDEAGERQVVLDMGDRVLLNGEDPTSVFEWGTEALQEIRDEFFSE